jgi:uncharacterized membrane protein YedE/YeeE
MFLTPYLPSLLGGVLIGASALLLMLISGRIAGVSGIAGGLLTARRSAADRGGRRGPEVPRRSPDRRAHLT